MSSSELEKKIRNVIRPVIDQQELKLVDLELTGGQRGRTVRVFVDKVSGVTVDECSALSREIGVLLDVQEVVDGPYRLEVSSPGIDRPLTADWQFVKNRGRDLKVAFEDGDDVKEVVGFLEDVEPSGIILILNKNKKDSSKIEIPFVAIRSARVQIQW